MSHGRDGLGTWEELSKDTKVALGRLEALFDTVWVAVCCSVLQCIAECCRVLQSVAECCRVLQCVAVCCSVL